MNGFSTQYQKEIWYRTKQGKIFLLIVSILGAGAVFFGGLVGFYLWQLNYGDADALKQTFSNSFTLVSQNTQNSAITPALIQSLNQPHSPVQGPSSAPVTVYMFIDFECPFCQQSYTVTQQIMSRYEGAVRFVFKHFPVESIHPDALSAALAAQCAQDQNKFWEYYDLLFQTKQLDENALFAHAQTLNLNTDTFATCLQTEKHLPNIQTDVTGGATVGVRGTPTYFVNDKKIEGAVDESIWNTILLKEIQNAS